MPRNQTWHAETLLWDCRKEGKSWRALQHSIPTSWIKCPLDESRRVKDELSAPPVVDYNAMDGDHTLLGAGTSWREKLGLMMAARKGNLYLDLWVRLCVDGTQLHKRHSENFMLECLDRATSLVAGAFYTALKKVLCYDPSQGSKWMSRCIDKRP